MDIKMHLNLSQAPQSLFLLLQFTLVTSIKYINIHINCRSHFICDMHRCCLSGVVQSFLLLFLFTKQKMQMCIAWNLLHTQTNTEHEIQCNHIFWVVVGVQCSPPPSPSFPTCVHGSVAHTPRTIIGLFGVSCKASFSGRQLIIILILLLLFYVVRNFPFDFSLVETLWRSVFVFFGFQLLCVTLSALSRLRSVSFSLSLVRWDRVLIQCGVVMHTNVSVVLYTAQMHLISLTFLSRALSVKPFSSFSSSFLSVCFFY